MPVRPRSPGEEDEARNTRSRPPEPRQPPVRHQYNITTRIDSRRRNEYSYAQIAVAPFFPNGQSPDLPHLSELFRSKVAAYRSITPADIPKVLVLLRLRAAFKKLAHVIIRRRCDKIPFQEIDPITLSSFTAPVILYDLKNRCRHKFEAKTLMIHIHRQLLHGSLGFQEPLAPRNPLTNIELTYGQLVSCYMQLRDAGHSIWTFSGFYSLNFNLSKFTSIYERPLRQVAIKSIVTEEMNEFAADQFVRFMQAYATHSNLAIPELDIYILRYAAIMRTSDYYMICWKRLYLIALAHNIVNGPVISILNDLETIAQARGLVVLSKILSQNLPIYIREIRPDYNRFIEENESKDDDSLFDDEDEDSEEEIGAYYNLIQTILGPGAGAPSGPGSSAPSGPGSGPSADRG